MICSACLDFHHAQLYQSPSLFSTRLLQNAERDKPCKISTFVSTEKLLPTRQLSQKNRWISPRNFQNAERENFSRRQVSVSRTTFAAPACRRNSLKFKTQLLTREAQQLFSATISGKTILSVSKNLERRKRFVFADTKRRTVELTWGETESAQV